MRLAFEPVDNLEAPVAVRLLGIDGAIGRLGATRGAGTAEREECVGFPVRTVVFLGAVEVFLPGLDVIEAFVAATLAGLATILLYLSLLAQLDSYY